MNQQIIKFILERRYWQKANNVPKSKWRTNISKEWIDYKNTKGIVATVEEFIEAWKSLDKK